MLTNQFLTTLTIDGRTMGTWDTFEGAGRKASSIVYRPGGNARPIALGGRAMTDNVTLGRLIQRSNDDWNEMVRLHTSRVGKAPAVVSQRPLDEDGNPYGTALVVRGILDEVNPPGTNSNEESEALWTVVVKPEG